MEGGNPGSGAPQPGSANSVQQELPLDVTEPALREDQIQNAVAFLSHPKVRGSAVSAKRSFLEKKGLTEAEINEAFKRVPETAASAVPAAPVPATTSTPTYGANNLVTYTQQAPAAGQPATTAGAAPQPLAAAPGAGALVPIHPQQQLQAMQPVQQPMRWSQVALGLGVAAAGIYGVHQLIAPRLTSWISHYRATRAAAAEAEAQRTAALTAALESLAAGQAKLQETLENLQTAIDKQKQQQQQQDGERYRTADEPQRVGYGGETVRSTHSEYLRCQSPGIIASQQRQQQQQQQQYYYGSNSSGYDSSRAAAIRGWDPYDSSRSPRSTAAAAGPAYSSASAAVNGYGPTDGFEVVPRTTPMSSAGPADIYSTAATAGRGVLPPQGPPSQQQQQQQSGVPGGRPDEAPHSAAFQEVMEMVRSGITPPNVRTDIDDNPPDPSRPISAPQLQPRGKPWERSSVSSNAAPKAVYGTPPATVADNFAQQQQQPQESFATHTSSHLQQTVSASGSAVIADMETAAAAKRKSDEIASGYDLSHLLGSDPASNGAPWRPPPPPAPTVTVRPTSSGSSSSRTAAPAQPSVAAPAPTDVSSGKAVVATEQLVADVAAEAVRNVVAGGAAAEPQEQAGQVQHEVPAAQ